MANRIEFETYVNPAGFKAGLTAMEASADATNTRLQNRIRSKIAGAEGRMAAADPNSWEYVQAAQRKATLEKQLLTVQNAMYVRNANARNAIQQTEVSATRIAEAEKVAANRAALDSIMAAEREQAIAESNLMDESIAKTKAAALAKVEANRAAWIAGQAEWRKIQAAQTATMLANFEEQRIAAAALKAEQLSMLTKVARGYGASVATGGHGAGGLSGIIRESLVIVREISMGRGFGRVAGSVTLLAQYMGFLGKVVKSTATESLLASAAETKLSQSMAATALAAESKALASAQAAAAETADTEAMMALAAADAASAKTARDAAAGQEAKAAASAQAAEVSLASAAVTISVIGWIVVAAVALIAVLAALIFHWHKSSVEARNLANLMNPMEKHYREEADAAAKSAKAHEELSRWLQRELENRRSLIDTTEEMLSQLRKEAEAEKELARAKGASMASINSMEVEQLRREKELTEAAEAQAKADLDKAKAAFDAANAAASSEPTENGVNLRGAKRVSENAGQILDAVENYLQGTVLATMEQARSQYGGGANMHKSRLSSTEAIEAGLAGVTGDMTIDEAIAKFRASYANSDIQVKVGNQDVDISPERAQKNFDEASGRVSRLEKAQEDLDAALRDAKGDVTASNEAYKKFGRDLANINSELGIKTGLGAQAAAAEDAKKGNKLITSDSLIKVGNFLGTARSGIESLASKQLEVAKQSLHHLKSMDGKMSNTHEAGGNAAFSGS